MSKVVVAALYQFTPVAEPGALRAPLAGVMDEHGIKGTLLLAAEGINGTVAGPRGGIDALLAWLRDDARFPGLSHKESFADEMPFKRAKVRLKQEIVTMGKPDIDPLRTVGTYVDPKDWNALVDDPGVTLVDTRNGYEVALGTFRGAADPGTESFREFPDYVDANLDPEKNPKVAMFCTGGIRCEKASAFMLKEGFEEVYHLRGGILKYLEEVPSEESAWEGECFVFDNRVAVDHELNKGQYDQCYGCRHPITDDDKASGKYEKGVCCPHCFDTLTDDQRMRFRERQKQVELARARGEAHVGAPAPARQFEA